MTRKKPNCSLILSGARMPAIQRSIGLKIIAQTLKCNSEKPDRDPPYWRHVQPTCHAQTPPQTGHRANPA